MGLLEKASNFTSGSVAEPAGKPSVDPSTSGAAPGIAGAVHGLRARADMFRHRVDSPVAAQTTSAARLPVASGKVAQSAPVPVTESRSPVDGGIQIRGLLRRAESMRGASDTEQPIPPLPESAARGLLARARQFRESAAPDAIPQQTASQPAPSAQRAQPRAADHHEVGEPAAQGLAETRPFDEFGASADVAEFEDTVDSGDPGGLAESIESDIFDSEEMPAAPRAAPGILEDEDLVLAFPDQADPVDYADPVVPETAARSAPIDTEPAAIPTADGEEAGGGLLERAERLRETPASHDALDASPGSDFDSDFDGVTDSAASDHSHLEDPLFDDLIPESHEHQLAAPTSPESSFADAPFDVPAATDDSSHDFVEERPDEALPDFDPGPAPVDAGLRDFDEFLERELLPEDMPETALTDAGVSDDAAGVPAAEAAFDGADVDDAQTDSQALFADEDYDALIDPDSDYGDAAEGSDSLPRWPYDPPGPDADPAREPHSSDGRTPGDDEDPFGLWEQDAEQEAELQARQLELKGDKSPADDEDNMLFEVDEGFTTAPVEAHIASQKKIDHYLSLFDITKEISNISEFDELWENILYAIMGQVGAETICILSSTQRVSSGAIFYPVSHSGFELPEGWALKRGDEIYDQMAGSTGVRYAEEFLNSLQNPISPLERRILESTRAKLVVPLKNMNQMFGIVILGGQVSGDDYTIDDIEFLTLLGEIAAVGVDRVLSRIEFERDTEELRRRNMVHGSMFSLARRASSVKSLDDIYDILTRHLREDFYADSFSVVLLSPRERRYRIFAGNEISPESIEKFSLDVNSELIATISNLVRVYDLKDFRENRELASCYTNDDLGLMQHYWIVPLINMNWLVGFITIHRTKIPWTEFHRELMVTAAEIVSSVFANCIIMSERESLFRDPFSPLEERLKQELDKSAQFQAPVSLVDIRVKNIRRILEINPGEEVTGFLMALNRSIASSLFETDFMARVGQGRFALILPGRGRVEADIFVKKLKAEFKRMRLLPGSPIDVQYAHQIISAPDDADEPGKMLSIFE